MHSPSVCCGILSGARARGACCVRRVCFAFVMRLATDFFFVHARGGNTAYWDDER